MKIVNGMGIKRYSNNSSKVRKGDSLTNVSNSSFDEITIRADKEEIIDRTFAAQCVDKIKKDTRVPAAEELITDLKQKIASHEYKIDYDRLVRKILLEE